MNYLSKTFRFGKQTKVGFVSKRSFGTLIPVIDIQPFIEPQANESDKKKTSNLIREAVEEIGFFFAKNTFLTSETVKESFRQTDSFFSLPLDKKLSCGSSSENPRGFYFYHGVGIGEERSESAIEAFLMGKETPRPFQLKRDYFEGRLGYDNVNHWKPFCDHRNRWPREEDKFKSAMLSCYSECTRTSEVILEGLAMAMNLDPKHFHSMHNKEDHTFELKKYPPLKNETSQSPKRSFQSNVSMTDDVDNDGANVRVKTHSDLSSVTLLLQNEVKGLEILTKQGVWVVAPSIPNTVLVNTGASNRELTPGEIMQRWSGGKFKSTKHRVVALPSVTQTRYTIVYFCTPNWETSLPSKGDETSPIYFGDLTPFH